MPRGRPPVPRRTEPAGCRLRRLAGGGWWLVLALAAASAAVPADDDAAEGAAPFGVVVLEPPARQLAAIDVVEIDPLTVPRELSSVALVVDPAPALSGRMQWLEARARIRGVDARRAAVSARLARLGADPTTTSRRELEALRAEVDSLAAEHGASAARAEAARSGLLLAWGEPLTERLLAPRATASGGLLGGRVRLLLVTVPTALAGRMPGSVRVRAPDAGMHAATLIGAAPHTDPLTRGTTVWASVDGTWARIGQRLTVWLADRESPVEGYRVPVSALVYREGAAWVYVEGPEDTFRRQRVLSAVRTAEGRVVRLAASGPQRVVVRGAQTLLSEELRWNIPDEDELD